MSAPGLYDGAGTPLLGSPPDEIPFADYPVCRLLMDHDRNPHWSGGAVDRQWVVASETDATASDVLADLVMTLDTGGKIAVLAENAIAAEVAIGTVLALAGGWRA